ncbi:MAG TPA: glycine cleavage T C-terminal barrel domain-containing protein [Vicinamibacterales bacterium]|nr:glycine cleavage T C-terminal barrel domain-containing protein [Vicinamibacterales bacterium]
MFSLDGYQAVQTKGGVVRRTDRRVLSVSGADRASWLQGLLTNDVQAMAEGEVRYAAYLTPQGRMITDMNVVAHGDRLLLDVPASLAAPLRDKLDALIFSEDVQITDESGHVLVWTVVNDRFIDVVAESLPAEFKALPEIDLDTFEVIRIERGIPKFLADMSEDTIPLEAGIEDRAISFSKGCYVGQEVIVRVTHRGGGRVAKRLVKWHADDAAPIVPMPDSQILAGEKVIGKVTSSAFSPSLNKVIGLGYVHRDYVDAGTAITIVWNDTRVAAVVK